jgi:5-methylcytosine-specific restriction endonuclease McrA
LGADGDKFKTPPMSECSHPTVEIRLRTLSNGTTAIYKQCLTCGSPYGPAMAKASLPANTALRPFDEEAQERYWSVQRVKNAEERQKKHRDSQAEYAEYLQGPAWKLKREAVMERERGLCQGCRHRDATEVHHLTYDHKYDELLFELVALCESCHRRCHEDQP